MSDVSDKIKQIRERFVKKYNGNILDDTYDERDVKWVKTNDGFLRNVVACPKSGNGNIEKSVDLINEILLFRAKYKLNDFTESMIDPELQELKGAYYHGTDKEGHKILIFEARNQKKGYKLDETRQGIAFWFNHHYSQTPEEQIVTLFDVSGAGIRNIDLDISKFIIQCASIYFPNVAAYSLMFKMGLALEAVWTIIKSFMDSDQTKNTHMVSRKNIEQYINKDQLMPHMIKEPKESKK